MSQQVREVIFKYPTNKMVLHMSVILLMIISSSVISKCHVPSEHHPEFTPSSRIVGGKEVNISDYPYQVSLEYYGTHHCGGAILDNSTIITAAHCTYEIGAGAFKIRAGTSTLGKGGEVVPVISKFEHPSFDHWTYDYDISILKLKTPLKFNEKVKSIIPSDENFIPLTKSDAAVSGWGSKSALNDSLSEELRAVNVSIVDSEKCSEAYADLLPITRRMLCAGQTGKDACHGDSGGPLVQNQRLIGIVSWGRRCGEPGSYGVYAKISEFHQFITSFIDK